MTQTLQTHEETKVYCDVTKRHDFAFLFDVTNGNPNGDPDAGNQPRVDPETMKGIVTDVCLKRKVRNFIDVTQEGKLGYDIYIKSRDIGLNDLHKQAHQAVFPHEPLPASQTATASTEEGKKAKGGKRTEKGADDTRTKESDAKRQRARRDWLCEQFYDVRTFGAVMSTGDYPSGQVRGPLQLTFAHSIHPIFPLDVSITRQAVAEVDKEKKTTSTMGRKSVIPYGLYLGYGFFTPHFAKQTGFSDQDLELFWQAMQHMWSLDRSASRGMVEIRKLIVFSHNNGLGNAPSHQLFDRIQVKLTSESGLPRSFQHDYQVTIDGEALPDGVTLSTLL